MAEVRNSVRCVFVHGWAMNSAVWDECIAALPDWIDVVLVDLPGHGTMKDVPAETLDDYVQALVPLVQRPAIWVGWSMGGLAVLRLAELYPQLVASVLLVAANPCFVCRPGWSSAVETEVFSQFSDNLKRHQEKTIQRFLALQVKGLPGAMNTVRQLQNSLESRGAASAEALVTGLRILLETDLRQNISLIEAPLHWLLGARDSLVPADLAAELKAQYGQEDVVLIPGSGHAPFISHQHGFIEQLLAIAEKNR